PDRRIFDLGYVNPHFFSRRGWLQAKYSNKSDGNRGTWLVGVPFYETAARHALITDGEAASERVLVFRRDPLGRSVVDTVARRASGRRSACSWRRPGGVGSRCCGPGRTA